MSDAFQNAVGWGHFQLRGGMRNILLTTGAYAAALGALIYITVSIARGGTMGVMLGWTRGLLVIQTGMLCLFGASAVTGALRQDMTTGMLESHRLMPVQPAWAVGGYLLGAASQAIAMGVATFLLGCITSAGARMPIEQWIVPNVILAIEAVFAWSMLLCATFQYKNAFWVLFFAGVIGSSAGGMLIMAVPALPLLFSITLGDTIYSLRYAIGNLGREFAIAGMVQIAFAAIFFLGAMRKYRRPEESALSVIPGLLLLAGWIAASIVALRDSDTYTTTIFGHMGSMDEVRFISAILTGMLLAIIPIANSARMQAKWLQQRHIHDPALGPRPIPPVFAALAAAGLIVLACLTPEGSTHFGRGMSLRATRGEALVRSAIVIASFVLAMCYLLGIFYRAGNRARLLGGIYVAVTWIVPLMIDLVRYSASNAPNADVLDVVSTASPAGALTKIWFGSIGTTGGIAFQAALAVGAIVLFHSTAGKPAAAKAGVLPPPPPPMIPPPLPPSPPQA